MKKNQEKVEKNNGNLLLKKSYRKRPPEFFGFLNFLGYPLFCMDAFAKTRAAENKIFHAAVIITFLLLTVLGLIVIYEFITLPNLIRRTADIERTAEKIRYLDEKLTMSATAAVYSGDPERIWQERYNNAATELDSALLHAENIERDILGTTAVSQKIADTNDLLITEERQAFELLHNGKRDEALSVITSPYYLDHKNAYTRALESMYAAIKNKVADNIAAIHRAADFKMMVFALSMVLLMMTWLAAYSLLSAAARRADRQALLTDAIIENMPAALYVKDLSRDPHPYIKFNRGAEEFFGFGRNEALQKSDKFVFSAKQAERNAEKDALAGESVAPVQDERERYDTAAGVRTATALRIPLHIDTKNRLLIVFLQDITKAVQDEERLQDYAAGLEEKTRELTVATERAQQAASAKSLFLANMSHELRTPMHAICSYADMGARKLAEEQDVPATAEKLEKYFGNIAAGAGRLSRLLDDLLDLSKMEAGHADLTYADCDINTVFNRVVAELEGLITARRLSLHVSSCAVKPCVPADEGRLIQVIVNIIANAIQFSPAGGVITLEAEGGGDSPHLLIAISDEGPGVPEEERDTVFDSFAQGKEGATGAGGTGLGLTICKQIIKAHKGTIAITGRTDGASGARVEITVPYRLQSGHIAKAGQKEEKRHAV